MRPYAVPAAFLTAVRHTSTSARPEDGTLGQLSAFLA